MAGKPLGANVGSAWVALRFSADGAKKDIQRELDEQTNGIGESSGKKVGGDFNKGFTGNVTPGKAVVESLKGSSSVGSTTGSKIGQDLSRSFTKETSGIGAKLKNVFGSSSGGSSVGKSLLGISKDAETTGNSLTSLGGNLGSLSNYAMPALVGAIVATAPVLVSLGTGFAGLGLAAVGIAKPIEKAAKATGGLKANLHTLTPEQQTVAKGLLNLQGQFHGFEKAVQPEVLSAFGHGLTLAKGLLKDIQPVTVQTGKAFSGFLKELNADFNGAQFQSFFKWMAANAGPDMREVSAAVISLVNDLPTMIEDLQPAANGFLSLATQGGKAVGMLAQLGHQVEHPPNNSLLAKINEGFNWLSDHIPAGHKSILQLIESTDKETNSAAKMGDSVKSAAGKISASAKPVWTLAGAVKTLTSDMQKNVTQILTLQGDQVGWRQSLQAATKQLNSNSAGLKGNSAKALANKQAVITSSNAVVQYASDQLTLHGNLRGASSAIQDQIKWLQKHGDKSKFAAQEIAALRAEEAKIKRNITSSVDVKGVGQWSYVQGSTAGHRVGPGGNRFARGGLVNGPGSGTSDSIPAMLSRGEVVVPAKMVSAGLVNHLRGILPGFASGGIVGSYKGNVGGLAPWEAKNYAATIKDITSSIAKSMQQAFTSSMVGNVGSGVTRWTGDVLKALAMLGLPKSDLGLVLRQMTTESGGNPDAINLTDSNAAAGDPSRGLLQTIGATFARWHVAGTSNNIYNPLANIAAALNYAIHGPGIGPNPGQLGGGTGYDDGGIARGMGFMPKRTIKPERVLSPNQTSAFDRLVDGITGKLSAGDGRPRRQRVEFDPKSMQMWITDIARGEAYDELKFASRR